jgi:hypothetical protein
MRRLYVLLASVVIATLLAASAASGVGKPGNPGPSPRYGALIVSPSLQKTYWSSSVISENWAVKYANDKCRREATDCTPGVWVKNGYAAFAMSRNGAWGTGWGHTESTAVHYAKTGCQTVGGVSCDAILQTYMTAFYRPLGSTTGGIPYIPPSVTEALPPATTGVGVGGTG